MNALSGPDGRRLYVDRSAAERGTKGNFYVVYLDADRSTRWGFRCGHCESLRTAVDPMGRIECTSCGNLRKAEEWDVAHE